MARSNPTYTVKVVDTNAIPTLSGSGTRAVIYIGTKPVPRGASWAWFGTKAKAQARARDLNAENIPAAEAGSYRGKAKMDARAAAAQTAAPKAKAKAKKAKATSQGQPTMAECTAQLRGAGYSVSKRRKTSTQEKTVEEMLEDGDAWALTRLGDEPNPSRRRRRSSGLGKLRRLL
jgi:hypothetical protein